jgi:hypothetical protein
MTGPVTVPAISLPKSGGALRGVDEKFAANPAAGVRLADGSVAAQRGAGEFDSGQSWSPPAARTPPGG